MRRSDAELFRRELPSRKRRLHPVGDRWRQHIGPLRDRLRRNPNRRSGARGGPAQQSEGFGFEHAPLNHGLRSGCKYDLPSPVSLACMRGQADWSTFGKRVSDALLNRNKTRKDLAAALRSPNGEMGVSAAAIGQILNGDGAFSAENASLAARFLNVDPHWLATGDGSPGYGVEQTIPFRDLNVLESQLVTFFRQLSPDTQHEVLIALNDMTNKGAAPSKANPFAGTKASTKARGRSRFGELQEERDKAEAAVRPRKDGPK